MKWGNPWANLWGLGAGDGAARACSFAQDRILVQMDDSPAARKFRDLVCELVAGLGNFEDVALDMARSFDLDTAVGDQLDKMGAVLCLPRRGFEDDRYRVFLQIQRDLVLSSTRDDANFTGTHNNILRLCRTFIGAGVDPIVLKNFRPYSYILSIPGVDLEEVLILITFLCVATWAGVLGQVILTLGPFSLWDSDSVGPIPNGGIWGSESVAVPNAAVWGLSIQIGILEC
jgi:hypothetical protein